MELMRLLPVAQAVAGLSKDPSQQIGAIIVDDDANILSVGFNGFPRGVHDHEHRLSNRAVKLTMVVHAEANAIAQAARTGVRVVGASMIVTGLFPCSRCAGLIIQAGIKRIYAPIMDKEANRQWHDDRQFSMTMFNEAMVEVTEYEPEKNYENRRQAKNPQKHHE